MGSPVDLTLGRGSSESQAVPSSNSEYHNDHLREAAQENLRILKEERQKVEGFKRELPLCIQLLDDAIKATEEKLVNGKGIVLPTPLRLSRNEEKESGEALSPESRGPTLEEFMPLKRRERDDQPSDISSDGELERAEDNCRTTKSNQPPWMVETRLWNPTASRSTEVVRDERTRDPVQSEPEQSSVTSSQQQQRLAGAGAFMPFQTQQPMPMVSRPRARSGGFCADLNLCVPATTLRAVAVEVGSTEAAAASPPPPPAPVAQMCNDVENFNCGGNSSSSTRKARRCWSPELHRRFVSALHQLGGSHIATPKQLRELMKVDGLTNDEVKSHLQKYRLHTRRPSPSPSPHPSAASAAPAAPPQLVVVGGIWMPPQHAASATANSQPGSVSDPSQFCHSGSLPLDYFAACINNGTPATAGVPAPMQMLQLHRQPLFETPRAAGTSQSQTSPQGPLQVTSQLSGVTQGSSSETYESGEEEAKSKSTSWNLCRQREGSQNISVEASQRLEPAEPKKLNVKNHEHGNAVQPQSLQTSSRKEN